MLLRISCKFADSAAAIAAAADLEITSFRVSPLVSVSYSSLSLYGLRLSLWLRPSDNVYSFAAVAGES